MPDFEDVVVEGGGAARGRTGQSSAPVADAITPDGRSLPVARSRGRSAMSDKPATGPLSEVNDPIQRSNGSSSGRVLPETVRSKIEALVKAARPAVDDDDDPDEPDAAPVAAKTAAIVDDDDPDEPDDGVATSPPAVAARTAPPEWESERDKLKAELDEHRSAAERYKAEVEAAKKATSPAADRLKRLDESEETYVRAPVDAFDAWLAAVNGMDPSSKEFEQERLDFYIDLTSKLTGAQADPSHQSQRSSALIRREWDRDKQRKRAADEEKQKVEAAPSDPGAPTHQRYVPVVSQFSSTVNEKHPELARLTKAFHGRSVEDVLAEVIDEGFKDGTFKQTEKDHEIIGRAAQIAETYYNRRRDEILGNSPSPATKPDAEKASAADAQVQTDKQRQGKGSRVTNADASVAPAATPPADKPSEPVKRTFKSDEEKKRYLTRKYLGNR